VKIVSWNVNGIRAALGKGLPDVLAEMKADYFCIQETKARPEQVDFSFDGIPFWNAAKRPGYSGTAVICRETPLNVQYGIDAAQHDQEGRVITIESQNAYLVNVYVPNVGRELGRLDYRVNSWGPAFRGYLQKLARAKPVIVCGDMNVAHQEIDLARPRQNVGNAGFTNEERGDFSALLECGFVDSFREVDQRGENYTWWSYQNQSRPRNIGWRIDYVCCSVELRSRLTEAKIYPDIMGSDHCPVSAGFDF